MSKTSYFLTTALTLATLLVGIPLALKQIDMEEPLPVLGVAPKISLIENTNASFNSDSLKGHVWVANFFFSSCQGPCPIVSGHMRKLAEDFSKKNSDTHFVSISVDPKRDSVKKLAEYETQFGVELPRWHLLTGAEEPELARLLKEGFKLGQGESFQNHSTRFILIDKKSNIRGYFDGMLPEDIKRLSQEITRLEKEE